MDWTQRRRTFRIALALAIAASSGAQMLSLPASGAVAGLSSAPKPAGPLLSSPGITEPILDATLGTPVAGIVAARKFKEGDFIREGEVLIELDNKLEELEVKRRAVVLQPLKSDFEANETLYKQPKSSVSKEMLERKEAEYQVALAEYELAREQVRKRLIIAPFDGFITDIFLQLGEACQIQQPIARLVDTRRCYFVCNVEAVAGHALKPDQTVALEIEAGPSVALVEGRVDFVSPVVDAASGLMKVKVVFDNSEGQIRPGVAGKMFFQEASHVSARK
jgi:RND family efflux transporter MFP subunit